MAERKFYIGSLGPFLYDDDAEILDPDGDFAGSYHDAVVTNGQLRIGTNPSISTHVIRLSDLHGHLLALRSQLALNDLMMRQRASQSLCDIIRVRVFT